MKKYIFITLTLIFNIPANARQVSLPDTLKGYDFSVSYSKGFEKRAKFIAAHVNDALTYYQQSLGFKPTIRLLILSVEDWKTHAIAQVVYGMPHYDGKNQALIVAAEDNAFWKSFLPPLDKLPVDLRKQVTEVYKTADNSLSMQAFFDLLAIHELGHAFCNQGGLKMQRKWMGELYANILLHTCIAENKPALLPALTLFPKMVEANGTKGFVYTSLNDAEAHYNELGLKYPANYGWYQCRWHVTAGAIYDAGGKKVIRKLWEVFKNQEEQLTDQEFMLLLEKADVNVANMVKNWDVNTIK